MLLLETFDITKVSSNAGAVNIFRSLGKLLLESFAERFLVALKVNGKFTIHLFMMMELPNLSVSSVICICNQIYFFLAGSVLPFWFWYMIYE